jgi:hypothetical protein
MASDAEDWETSSEEGYQPSTSTSEGTVRKRMYQLESDEESGWYNRDRHSFSLVRVPEAFLEALKVQVQPSHARFFLFCSPPAVHMVPYL